STDAQNILSPLSGINGCYSRSRCDRTDVTISSTATSCRELPTRVKGKVAMNYWLVKSEPSTWSWDQQVAKGAKGEAWTGVRNFTARQNLVTMKKGDKAFY